MQWRGLWSLIVIAIVTAISDARKIRCSSSPSDRQVTVNAVEGHCSKKWCKVGTTVLLSCKKKWLQLFGPRDVTCTKEGWSTDINRAQCIPARNISEIRAKTTPTVSLAYSGEEIPSLTDSLVSLTSVQWSEVGSKFSASCQSRWTNGTAGAELPLYTKWFKVASDSSQVLVAQQQTSNEWSTSSEAGDRSDITVNSFQEKGNYTYKCIIYPWHPWSPIQATVEVTVTEPLCPHVEPPCDTDFVGPFTEQNRTESSTIHFKADPGWVSVDRPLVSKCLNSDWDPPINWLGVERVKCPPLELKVGVNKRLLDGPWDSHFGAWYYLSCTDHLTTLTGFPRVYCNSSGMWDPDPNSVTCKTISCGDPPKVPFAECDCPNQNHSIEAVCKCTCDSGYIFDKDSNKKIECRSTGWWPPVNTLPPCIPCQRQCKKLPTGWKFAEIPSSGFIKIGRKKAFCNGVVVQVTCKRNPAVRGTLRCEGGSWTETGQRVCS